MQKRTDKVAMPSHFSYIRCQLIICVLCRKVTALTVLVTTSKSLWHILNDIWTCTDHSLRETKPTIAHTHKYVNLLYYEKRSLLFVSATYCGQIQGDILWKIYCIEGKNNLIYIYITLSLNKIFKSVLKFKMLIKLFVMSCELIFFVLYCTVLYCTAL